VQGECKAKKQSEDLLLALPNRSLSYPKVVQGESKAKKQSEDLLLALPNRSLAY